MHSGRPAAVLDGLHDELGAALQVDVHGLSDDELLDGVADVYRLEARLAALKARLVGEADARQAYSVVRARTMASWIAHRSRVPRGAAGHDVVVARTIRHLPGTAAKLADGDIGEAHAAALCRHHRNPRTQCAVERDEAVLAEHAATLTYAHFATALAYWAQHADPDGTDDDAEARRSRRQVHLSRTFDAMWALDGVFPSIDGTIVHTTLQHIEDDLRHAGDNRTSGQLRADALVEMARRAMSAPPGSRRPAPLVTILVSYETFAGRICELADGTVLAPRDVAALLDEAVIERAIFDGPSRVLDIGEQRCFTGALRRAIELRDRRCTHPWCDIPAERCHIDHRIPWEAGGPTTQDNGRVLCAFHNYERHRAHTVGRAPPE